MKTWCLKFHRWIALVFALPLLFVIGTGLVLSVEPWLVVRAIAPGTLTAAKVQALLDRHDAQGQARALSYRSYDNTLTIGGRGGGRIVDAASGEAQSAPSRLASLLGTARRTHEHLLLDLGWAVVASTMAMLALALFGVLMGWPRIRNTLAGWHKAMAWGLLPLVVLSPLTGLFLVYGVTFSGAPPAAARPQGPPPTLREAVDIAGRSHDLSALVWLRPLGGRMALRVVEEGEYRLYAVTRAGTVALPRNWPRLWHEGNFAGIWSSLMNLVVSVAMLGLLGTGVWMWLRRRLRVRSRPARAGRAAPA
jgi:uncharacterized iron-regulated membrane protein